MDNIKIENIELINRLDGYIEKIDTLDKASIEELYHLNKILTKVVNLNISDYGTELRVILCRQQDALLNRLIQFDIDNRNDKLKNIYTPAVQDFRQWTSVEFFKDKGLVGYFLGKELEATHKMVFCSKNDVDNVKELLPEQELIVSNEEEPLIDQYLNLLKNEYNSMDVLVLHGMYTYTLDFLEVYRKLRPDGKVYCGLDMNSAWLSRIRFTDKGIKNFLSNCDVVATSSKKLRDMVNNIAEVNTPCYYLSNGFSNFLNLDIIADANYKENVILTVGRIGTVEKNNGELLLAFAKIAHKIPDWSLRLVGPIEESFKPFIDKYFEKCPDLIDRVVFTGAIFDKQKLYYEYAKAKCFVLTSPSEGAPNVYAEALVHGCKFIFSNFDSAQEMVNDGELGYVYELGNLEELSQNILKIAKNSTSKDFEEYIPKALKYAKDNYDWEKNAKKLAYMLNN